MEDRLEKWRLILGRERMPKEDQVQLSEDAKAVDDLLEALYGQERKGGLGPSSPNVSKWLGDIRDYFPTQTVKIMQKDALERLKLEQMLLEPELLESLEADVNLVATLLTLKDALPEKTKSTAKEVVRKVVAKLEQQLKNRLQTAIRGAIDRNVRNYRPKYNEIDWHRTIRVNLKHYNPELKTIIPERLVGYGHRSHQSKHIILLVDQSGSMANSVVYSGIIGSVMASLTSVKTNVIAFDTKVVNLTEYLEDPVELLFATQLGGGTDINNAVRYTEKLIVEPNQTILVLISDLYEGGNVKELIDRVQDIAQSGVQFITLLALSDQGTPSFDKNVAGELANLNIPAFACTPDLFPDLMAAAIQKTMIKQWAAKHNVIVRN